MADAASIVLAPDFELRLLRQYDLSAILHSHTSCVATLRTVPVSRLKAPQQNVRGRDGPRERHCGCHRRRAAVYLGIIRRSG